MTAVTVFSGQKAQYFALASSVPQVTCAISGGNAVLDISSYRDFLSEHTGNRHYIGSSIIVLIAVGVILFLLA